MSMRIVACQLDIVWEDKHANFDRVRQMLAQANLAPGTMVVLPEMFATGFSMNAAQIAEAAEAETEQFLSATARERGVALVAGMAARGSDGRARNEAVAFSADGRLLARYAKLHPFRLGGESQHYAAGQDVAVFACHEWRVAPFICYDLRFPEVFRAAVGRGAELLLVIANWPAVRAHHWLPLLRARAIENQACVVGVNRCGLDPHHAYSGRTVIIHPQGDVLADAGENEGVISADLEPAVVTEYRREFPALADLRKEFLATPEK